jgi:hypothetical protein
MNITVMYSHFIVSSPNRCRRAGQKAGGRDRLILGTSRLRRQGKNAPDIAGGVVRGILG